MNDQAAQVAPTIGFIGLGDQGAPMARSIARAGFPLVVFDLRPEAYDGFTDLGATIAESVADLAQRSDIVAFCVQNEKQALGLVVEDPTLLNTMEPGQVLVMHSTVSAKLSVELAAAAESHGVGFLDAPVSGRSMKAREHGELAAFVGGSQEDFDKAKPLLDAIGDQVELLGPVGSGSIGKLCNNLMLFCNTFGSLEAARLAAAYSIEPDTMVRMALHGSGRSWSLEEWGFWHRMIPNHPSGDSRQAIIDFLQKDLRLALDAARDAGVELAMGERANDISPDVIGRIWDEATSSSADRS